MNPKEVYTTANKQERLVIEVSGDKVVYATRGGNIQNDWNWIEETSQDNFDTAVTERVLVMNDQAFAKALESCNYRG